MRQKSVHPESPSERIVKNIRRATRKRIRELPLTPDRVKAALG
jgi:hypothetical protein